MDTYYKRKHLWKANTYGPPPWRIFNNNNNITLSSSMLTLLFSGSKSPGYSDILPLIPSSSSLPRYINRLHFTPHQLSSSSPGYSDKHLVLAGSANSRSPASPCLQLKVTFVNSDSSFPYFAVFAFC
ncbi:hypothetical protein E2C01_035598 [Portunus trituberculatus]|uniref:Uncharacterized protein n=1 Tax=Portunus trituberculatus TaxID=210409 RepID=A0A5B7F9L0_PORTR|nr:hypothetical protein [Portunus trituberculatus]